MPRGKKKQLVNHFVICLDRSGSMQPIQRQAVDTFNQNVNAIRDGAKQNDQESTVTLVTFGDNVKTEFYCEDVASLRTYDYQEYVPAGSTPLFDAVGKSIDRLNERKDSKDKNVSYMFIIITDGEENTSKNFTAKDLTSLMGRMQKTDRWSFAFLLPKGASKTFCSQFGIPDGNVKEWEASAAGMRAAAVAVQQGIGAYYSCRSTGKSSMRGFFTTDLSSVSVKEVKKALDDIRDKVNVWTIPSECDIRPFCETKTGHPYIRGNAYYQLTKDELVQASKAIILVEKGKSAVYAGEDARSILGLPDGENVKVRPGNHSNWDIFVQSKSLNRRLVRGTKLVYMK
jgi:uncharacterized protein YegL